MHEKPHPDRDPDNEVPSPHLGEPPQIDTPVIDMQNLERVTSQGVRVEPTIDNASLRDFAKDDEAALAAIEKLDRSLGEQLPDEPALTKSR